MPSKAQGYLTSCLLFALFVIALLSNFEMMLTDTDSAWHLMAGDWIREHREIPKTDPWSYTAAGAPWVNMAWLWDVLVSFLHAHLGWYGQVAFLSIVISLTMVVLYHACLLRSGNGIASFFSVVLVLISIPLHLRALWASNLFLACLFLLALLIQYRGWSIFWWYILPPLMALWVNLHGGFVVAFALLGAFGLQALIKRQWRVALHLSAVGILSIAALGLNPYGYAAVISMAANLFLSTPALSFIAEFRPTRLSASFMLSFLYIPVFLFFALTNKPRTSIAEAILGFGLIPLAFMAERYWTFVYLFSCPLLAQYFAGRMKGGKHAGHPKLVQIVEHAKHYCFSLHAVATYLLATLFTVIFVAALFTPQAAKRAGMESYDPYRMFTPALRFAMTNYPLTSFYNDYELGGPLIALSDGAFPVFIDSRGETAYPRKVVLDLAAISRGKDGWEKILDDYGIGGIITGTYRDGVSLPARLDAKKEWKQVFEDGTLAVYVRAR